MKSAQWSKSTLLLLIGGYSVKPLHIFRACKRVQMADANLVIFQLSGFPAVQ